jgi:hypothetical protein
VSAAGVDRPVPPGGAHAGGRVTRKTPRRLHEGTEEGAQGPRSREATYTRDRSSPWGEPGVPGLTSGRQRCAAGSGRGSMPTWRGDRCSLNTPCGASRKGRDEYNYGPLFVLYGESLMNYTGAHGDDVTTHG